MSAEVVNPLAVQEGGKSAASKSLKVGKSADFEAFLGAAEAFGPTAATAGQMYGDPNSSAVLGAAFSGVTTLRQQSGTNTGYVPAFSNGMYGSDPMFTAMGGAAKYNNVGGNNNVVAGVDGFTQNDMMNSLQQNSMQLLEMQAALQTHMQEANIKSNILSADHRARMSMIEKFTARG